MDCYGSLTMINGDGGGVLSRFMEYMGYRMEGVFRTFEVHYIDVLQAAMLKMATTPLSKGL